MLAEQTKKPDWHGYEIIDRILKLGLRFDFRGMLKSLLCTHIKYDLPLFSFSLLDRDDFLDNAIASSQVILFVGVCSKSLTRTLKTYSLIISSYLAKDKVAAVFMNMLEKIEGWLFSFALISVIEKFEFKVLFNRAPFMM